jgi:hypothetical protein
MDAGERDAWIAELYAQGFSTRVIARRVGISRSRVQQITSGLVIEDDDDDDPWTDDTEARLALMDGEDDTDPPGPFTFVGHGEDDEPRWLGSDGRSANALHVYRWCFGEGAPDTSAERQRRWDEVWTMAGYVRVPDKFGCGTYWERVS